MARSDDQNLYLKLNCQIRMNPAWVEMRPKVGVLIALFVDSLPNLGVFVRFRISNRISPAWPPANCASFDTTRSMFLRNWFSALSIVRGAVPYWPRPGFANAA